MINTVIDGFPVTVESTISGVVTIITKNGISLTMDHTNDRFIITTGRHEIRVISMSLNIINLHIKLRWLVDKEAYWRNINNDLAKIIDVIINNNLFQYIVLTELSIEPHGEFIIKGCNVKQKDNGCTYEGCKFNVIDGDLMLYFELKSCKDPQEYAKKILTYLNRPIRTKSARS